MLALILPISGYAQPKVPAKVKTAKTKIPKAKRLKVPAKIKTVKTKIPQAKKLKAPKVKKLIKKAISSKTLVCKNGKRNVMKTKGIGKKAVLRGESIPCCVWDDKGCICSSDDCDDCKGITREIVDDMVKKQ